jgi:hypothetical protein
MQNIGNSLTHDLKSRAQNLHANSAQLDKQMKDVEKGTQALKKENEKLGKLAKEGDKKMKELGNVQNWAEMLERDFLLLEETLRLAREGSDSGSWTGSSSWSGSEDGERDEESLAGDKRRELIGAGFGIEDEGRGFLDIYGLSEDTTMEGVENEHDDEGKAIPNMHVDTVMRDVGQRHEDKGKGKEKVVEAEEEVKHLERGFTDHPIKMAGTSKTTPTGSELHLSARSSLPIEADTSKPKLSEQTDL